MDTLRLVWLETVAGTTYYVAEFSPLTAPYPGYAAMTGKTDIVKVLLKEKALINAMDGHGETALIKAVSHGHVNASEMLLNKGADANILAGSGKTAH